MVRKGTKVVFKEEAASSVGRFHRSPEISRLDRSPPSGKARDMDLLRRPAERIAPVRPAAALRLVAAPVRNRKRRVPVADAAQETDRSIRCSATN